MTITKEMIEAGAKAAHKSDMEYWNMSHPHFDGEYEEEKEHYRAIAKAALEAAEAVRGDGWLPISALPPYKKWVIIKDDGFESEPARLTAEDTLTTADGDLLSFDDSIKFKYINQPPKSEE